MSNARRRDGRKPSVLASEMDKNETTVGKREDSDAPIALTVRTFVFSPIDTVQDPFCTHTCSYFMPVIYACLTSYKSLEERAPSGHSRASQERAETNPVAFREGTLDAG